MATSAPVQSRGGFDGRLRYLIEPFDRTQSHRHIGGESDLVRLVINQWCDVKEGHYSLRVVRFAPEVGYEGTHSNQSSLFRLSGR